MDINTQPQILQDNCGLPEQGHSVCHYAYFMAWELSPRRSEREVKIADAGPSGFGHSVAQH